MHSTPAASNSLSAAITVVRINIEEVFGQLTAAGWMRNVRGTQLVAMKEDGRGGGMGS